jgi:hypothetical protein
MGIAPNTAQETPNEFLITHPRTRPNDPDPQDSHVPTVIFSKCNANRFPQQSLLLAVQDCASTSHHFPGSVPTLISENPGSGQIAVRFGQVRVAPSIAAGRSALHESFQAHLKRTRAGNSPNEVIGLLVRNDLRGDTVHRLNSAKREQGRTVGVGLDVLPHAVQGHTGSSDLEVCPFTSRAHAKCKVMTRTQDAP